MNHARQIVLCHSAILRLSVVAILLIPLSGCFVVEFMLTKQIANVSLSPSGNEVAFLQFPNQVSVKSLDIEGEFLCQLRVPLMSERVHFTFHGMMFAVDQPDMADHLFALGDVTRSIAFYDVNSCELTREMPLPGLQTTTALAFSNDGSFLLRSSEQSGSSDVRLDLIDVESGESIKQWTYLSTHPISFALSGDDSLVFLGMAQHKAPNVEGEVPRDHIGKVALMRMPTGELVREWVESDTLGIRAVAISADGTTIALKFYDGTIKVTHLPTGESNTLETPTKEVEESLATVDALTVFEKLLLTPDGSVVFVQSALHAESLYAFRVDSGEQVKEYEYEDDIGDFAITSDGKRLVVGTEAGEIKIEELGLQMERSAEPIPN